MPKRARSKIYPGPKKGSAVKNDNTGTVSGARQSVRVLSSQGATAVGRPGHGGFVPGPTDGKLSVRRLMVRDPAVGRQQPAADKITTTNVDLVGTQNPKVLSALGSPDSFASGKRTIGTGQPSGGPKSPPKKR